MLTLADYFPWYAWAGMLLCALLAMVPFFVPPSLGTDAGLSVGQYIIVVAGIEFVAAVGIAALVVYYRKPEREDSEWRFEP